MSNLKNKVQLIGNVGGNPENIQLENESTKLVKFSLATNETYKNAQGEKVTDTEWHNIIAWGKTAQFVEKHLTEGKHIALEGKIKTRSYETESGEKRYITEVVARDIVFLSAKGNDMGQTSTEEE